MFGSSFISRYLPQRFSDRNGATDFGYYCDVVAVASGTVLVAGQAGKRIFVPHLVVAPGAAGRTQATFRSGSSLQMSVRTGLPTDPNPSVIFPFNEAGWICTAPGDGVLVNVGTDSALISFGYFIFQV